MDADVVALAHLPDTHYRVAKCDSACHVNFNVMPDRPVSEERKIREFRIGPTWIEAEFDGTCHYSMLNRRPPTAHIIIKNGRYRDVSLFVAS